MPRRKRPKDSSSSTSPVYTPPHARRLEPGETSRWSALEESEREYARHYGTSNPVRPAFAHLVNLNPPGSGVEHAKTTAYRIRQVLDRSGWTKAEYNQLWVAWRRWQKRAEGQDRRYLLYGTRPGRLPNADRANLRGLGELAADVRVHDATRDLLRTVRRGERVPGEDDA